MAEQMKMVKTAVAVRLTDWHDTSQSYVASVSCYDDLRAAVGHDTKLYFFDERGGVPRSTVRLKITDDDGFPALREQPFRPVTVYFYSQRDDDPDSPPQGRPQALATGDAPGATVSSGSSRSTTVQNIFRENVVRRYSFNRYPIVCLLCGNAED